MTMHRPFHKVAVLLGCCTALSGCFLQPGEFDSTMTVMQDGRFSFTYDGEIVAGGIGDMAEMADKMDNDPPEPCIDDATAEERPCTPDEIAAREAEEAQQMAMMQAMMGGADLSKPETAEEFAQMLRRQRGWNSVEVSGEGVFTVSFAISSQLGHDFDFPTMEGLPAGTAFVSARLRGADRVRIEAPGFAAMGGGNPMMAMFSGMMSGMAEASETEGGDEVSGTPAHPMRGTFRLVTDAPILTNNTDEGPSDEGGRQVLTWDITPDSASAPAALLKLQP